MTGPLGLGAPVPVLETERLLLRGHTLADFPACAEMWGDEVVTRHIGGRASTREEVWARLVRYPGHWALMGFGFWAVEEKGSGRFVGELGYADFRRDTQPDMGRDPEVGWALSPWAHGRGFATEAVKAATAWGDTQFQGRRTWCMIDPDNAASIAVAEKAGYRRFATGRYKDGESLFFVREP